MSRRADEPFQLVSSTVKHNKLQEATLSFFVVEVNPIGIFELKGNAHSSFIDHKGCLESWPVSHFQSKGGTWRCEEHEIIRGQATS